MQVQRLMDILAGNSPPLPLPSPFPQPITRVLLAVAGISGLCFAATLTADKTGWATGFGLLLFAAGLGLIALAVKRKMR